MGNRGLVRALRAVAALTIAVASCGGSSTTSTSSKPAQVSAAAALRNPCLLITNAQAQAIVRQAEKPQLGSSTNTESGLKSNFCYIIIRNSGTIDITVQDQLLDPLSEKILISNPAPVPQVGHQAVCGLSLEYQALSAKAYELYAVINSHYSLEVSGGLSCAVDADFASEVYSHLS